MKNSRGYSGEKAGLYVHIPFCVQKCIYCDFNSLTDCSHRLQSDYFQGLKQEIGQFWKSLCSVKSYGSDLSSDLSDFADGSDNAGGVAPDNFVSLDDRCEDDGGAFADTLFIGGGTPSSVDPALIEDLMRYVRSMKSEISGSKSSGSCGQGAEGERAEESNPKERLWSTKRALREQTSLLSEDAEITMEVNPATVDHDSLVRYRQAGINRLSIGVQSFQDDELKFLGRIHTAEDAERCFTMARKAGFKNINIDLIFGIPGSTADSWRQTLQRTVSLKPDHISFYSLQIEEGTPLYQLFRRDQAEQVSDEEDRRMYHGAIEFLEKTGYHQYEISNAALEKKECRHNLKYWTMCDYAGFGVSAHSYLNASLYKNIFVNNLIRERGGSHAGFGKIFQLDVPTERKREKIPAGGVRFFNEDNISDYLRRIGETEAQNGGYIPFRTYENTLRDEISESFFTGMRKKEGISLEWFDKRFQGTGITFLAEFGQKMKPFIDEGFLIFDGKSVRFSMKGFDVSNHILAALI